MTTRSDHVTAHVDRYCLSNLPEPADSPSLIFTLPTLTYPARLNCAAELLTSHVRDGHGDSTCIVTPDGARLSYAELDVLANQMAHYLVSVKRLVPGNRVLLRGRNTPWLVVAWFAVLKVGGVVVTTVPSLRATELTAIDKSARVDHSICAEDLLAELEKSAVQTSQCTVVRDLAHLSDLIATQQTDFEAIDTAADDIALLAYTSGSTGDPKGTLHFHRDVLAIADTFSAQILRPTSEDLFVGTPPMAFTFGLGGLLVFPMRVGASSLLVERATPVELADLIYEHGATMCFTAPTAYRAILAAGKIDRLATLRRAVSAGEHLPQTVWEQIHQAIGLRLIDGIGATELLHIFISAADDDIRPGATGRVVPGFEAKVTDASGQEVPRGTPGQLAVRGPLGCRYLADPRQREYVRNGWNVTGDTFVQDDDDYFWYQARSDDMIISSGYSIAGPEVEEALLAHRAVAEVAVVGTPDEDRGHLVHAYVVAAPGVTSDDALADELQAFVKSQIAPYKYPRRITFVPTLPRTNTGKLQRFRLRVEPEHAI